MLSMTSPFPLSSRRRITWPVNGLMRVFGSVSSIGEYRIHMALRCLYVDLDGTLLGKNGSLFRDAEGNFSRAQALTFEACHRADVEVVIMSGRREAQVRPDARLFSQRSYVYEAGCGLVIDDERTYHKGG